MITEELRRRLILALDFPYVQEAIGMIHKVRPAVMHYKVGLELWASTGGDLFHYFNEEELDFFEGLVSFLLDSVEVFSLGESDFFFSFSRFFSVLRATLFID